MSVRRRCALPVVVLLLAAVPSVAVATSGSLWFIGKGEGGGSFTLVGSTIKTGAVAPSSFKCNKLNAVIAKSIPVKAGAFSYTGKLKGQSGTVTFKGKFSGKTSVKGSTTITKGSCKSTLKWSGKPQAASLG